MVSMLVEGVDLGVRSPESRLAYLHTSSGLRRLMYRSGPMLHLGILFCRVSGVGVGIGLLNRQMGILLSIL